MADAPDTPIDADLDPVSDFFRAESAALAATAAGGLVLDLACGQGRHALAACALGLSVLAIDRNEQALTALDARGQTRFPGRLRTRVLDLETEAPPTIAEAPFAAILVFRYLHRPLASVIEDWLAPGGLLLYETFTTDQRSLGWGPTRDAFLLAPGELPRLFPRLVAERFEEGRTNEASPAFTARLRARRPR